MLSESPAKEDRRTYLVIWVDGQGAFQVNEDLMWIGNPDPEVLTKLLPLMERANTAIRHLIEIAPTEDLPKTSDPCQY